MEDLLIRFRTRFDAACFDMDGTLVDSEKSFERSWHVTLNARGIDTSEFDYDELRGLGGPESCRRIHARYGLAGTVEDFTAEWVKTARAIVIAEAKLCLGVRDVLAFCETARLPKALVTTSSGEYTELILGHVGIIDRFGFLVTRTTMEKLGAETKPKPYPYLLAAWRMGVDPKRMLVFEDSFVGMTSAKAAGCPSVGISHGMDRAARELADAGADIIVDTLDVLDLDEVSKLP